MTGLACVVPEFSEWLQLMLAEILRRREEEERSREEARQRQSEHTLAAIESHQSSEP